MNTPMLNTYCRRCHAAIISTAQTCPLCGLTRPNPKSLTDTEKYYLANPPNIPARFEKMVSFVSSVKSFVGQITGLYSVYLRSSKDSDKHQNALWGIAVSIVFFTISSLSHVPAFMHIGIMFLIFSLFYLVYDFNLFFKSAYATYVINSLQIQGGTSPYSVHFKIETVIQNTLKSLQSLLYAFYDKPWEELAKDTDIVEAGNSFILATQAITAKLKKYANLSLETITLLWRNNVYAITSLSNLSNDEKITHLNLKIIEARAVVLRYLWLRQLDLAYEFLEAHLKGESGRTTDEDRSYVIEGMQLGLMGPLTEPYNGNLESVPFELPFVMRYYWHQQLKPTAFPADEIKAQYPETSDLFESIEQVQNLIKKIEEQKVMEIAENAVKNDFKTETEITSEANQIKRFQLYSDYLDIPKFKPNDEELLKLVDRLNAQLKL